MGQIVGIEEQLVVVEQESDIILLVILLDPSSIITSSGKPSVADRLQGDPLSPCLLVFMLLCYPYLLSVGGTCDLILTNRIWQGCQLSLP